MSFNQLPDAQSRHILFYFFATPRPGRPAFEMIQLPHFRESSHSHGRFAASIIGARMGTARRRVARHLQTRKLAHRRCEFILAKNVWLWTTVRGVSRPLPLGQASSLEAAAPPCFPLVELWVAKTYHLLGKTTSRRVGTCSKSGRVTFLCIISPWKSLALALSSIFHGCWREIRLAHPRATFI